MSQQQESQEQELMDQEDIKLQAQDKTAAADASALAEDVQAAALVSRGGPSMQRGKGRAAMRRADNSGRRVKAQATDYQDDGQDRPPVDLGGFGVEDRPDLAGSLGSGLLGFHPGMFDSKAEPETSEASETPNVLIVMAKAEPRRHEPDPEDDPSDAVHRSAQILGRRSAARRRRPKRPELVMPKMSPDPPERPPAWFDPPRLPGQRRRRR